VRYTIGINGGVFMNFNGKVVLITGSGAGIGRAAALAFANAGAKVVVNSVTEKSGCETAQLIKESGGSAVFVQGDVSKVEDAQAIVEKGISEYGRLDIVVNCAGIVIGGRIEDTSLEDWERTMQVNVRGVFLISKYAVKHMKKQGSGTIINVASVCAVKGVQNRAAYSASKGAVLSLSKAMAADHIRDNIRINCICPGTVHTPSLEQRINSEENPEQAFKNYVARQPMGRLGKPEEIAQAILFAACDEAAFMNGSNIIIDGGSSI